MRHARDVAIGGRPRRARGTPVAPTLLVTLALSALMGVPVNGQNGTYVDVTPTVTEQVSDRFGTQPSHRSGHTMTRVDATTAVVFGGLTHNGAANDVWEWKVSTGNWTRLHPGGDPPADGSDTVPPRRVGHSAVILRGDLWIFGGYDVAGGDMNDLWRFSRAEGRWYAVELPEEATTPPTRSGHAAFAPDDDGEAFFVFGGNMRNDVWAFDVGETAWRVVMGETAATSGGVRRRVEGVFLALGMATASAIHVAQQRL